MRRANLDVIGIGQVVVYVLDKRFSIKADENIRLYRVAGVDLIANRRKIGVVDVRGKNIEVCRRFSDIA